MSDETKDDAKTGTIVVKVHKLKGFDKEIKVKVDGKETTKKDGEFVFENLEQGTNHAHPVDVTSQDHSFHTDVILGSQPHFEELTFPAIEVIPFEHVKEGLTVKLKVHPPKTAENLDCNWTIYPREEKIFYESAHEIIWQPSSGGSHTITVSLGRYTIIKVIKVKAGEAEDSEYLNMGLILKDTLDNKIGEIAAKMPGPGKTLRVSLDRSVTPSTCDQILWRIIKFATERIQFKTIQAGIDLAICNEVDSTFRSMDAYEVLRDKIDSQLKNMIGVADDASCIEDMIGADGNDAALKECIDRYYKIDNLATTPYLRSIASRPGMAPKDCDTALKERLTCPVLLELIWSYWMEEGMLVQTMNAISVRFQNRRLGPSPDPLANFDIDPLRRLNNLMWGYIQDEQHRLSIQRRVYEYDHEYGLTLYGKAVPELQSADSRSKFLEAFHNLLYLSSRYFREQDDTTIYPDAFPLLNSLREVHLLLAEGAHNQYGDLPWTARREMLLQQWLLSRTEIQQFLGGRIMVPYEEPWMDRVDTMKKIQGWTDVSITHFYKLAVYGEQVLLSVRHGDWNSTNMTADNAANWARFWRSAIQDYTYSYRVVTGVDLTADAADARQASVRYMQPSLLLRNRLARQRQRVLR